MREQENNFDAQDELDAEYGGRPEQDYTPPVKTLRRRLAKLAGLAGLLVAGFAGWNAFGKKDAPAYTHAAVERGDIARTITATGKLEAVVTVEVGSQVSGRISEIQADFNTRVKKGQVIARIDPEQLQAQLEQARGNQANAQAGLQSAQGAVQNAAANVASAEANLERARFARQDAERAHRRLQELVTTGAVSTREVEVAEAAFQQADAQFQQAAAQLEQAKAQLVSARSQVNQSQAQIRQTKASVELASVNLSNTYIRAPIDGIVIARNVDVGQTVAASFQAPTLFLIANDLTQMQVLADIDEADVGQVEAGSSVRFTVDAYRDDIFEGSVSQVRLNPQTIQNVVTYTAVINVSNPELKLKPGMTANVTAIVAESKDVLKIPNAALRFRPEAAEAQAPSAERIDRSGAARGRQGVTVWKLENGKLNPVSVRTGLSDGLNTEIRSGDLQPGDLVATGQTGGATTAASSQPRNPMMPYGGGRGAGGGRR